MKQTVFAFRLAPTDLGNFASCRHLAGLDLQAARGAIERPARRDPVLEDLRARGLAHEKAYLQQLRDQGLRVAGDDDGSGAQATLAAMRAGIDVIYQATLEDEAWSGRVDFLRRIDTPSALGDWSYEPYDTKLARDTRASSILQLCVYALLLEKAQGVRPLRMHVVTPGTDFVPSSFRVDDFAAYFRLLAGGLREFLSDTDQTYPEPVSHCEYCAWWAQCEARRRADDHLGYVAGISTAQIKVLRGLNVKRLEELAALDPVPDPPRGTRDALARIREQARVQKLSRERGEPYHELRTPYGPEHGLALLPAPTADDIFLDFEGDHFAEEGVREYLLGFVTRAPAAESRYEALWASTLEEERAAFERFIDFAMQTRARNPAAHIYHFAAYEPAALKRLMGRHATREVELDELLRGKAFVDLHTVVKRALIAGVERYSIKDLEPLFGYARAQDLREATMSRRIVEMAVATGVRDDALDPHRRIVEDYNREDCESAARLRDWLERLRTEAVAAGQELPRPPLESGQASEEISDLDRELQRLRDGLLEGLPADPAGRSIEQQALFVLAHMMEFHRREDKATWWEYFRVLGLDESALADERRALAGLSFDRVLEAKKAPLQRYRFPAQELDARARDKVFDPEGNEIGTVAAVNYVERTIDVKKRMTAADAHPDAVVLFNRIPSKALRESLMRLGEAVLASGFSAGAPWRAAIQLLLRRPPPGGDAGGTLQRANETTVEAACRIALALDGNVLAIQGPPGTGKTYTGAHVICALVRAGLKVGVTAVSHKVIVNLLEAADRQAQAAGLPMKLVDRDEGEYRGDGRIERKYDYKAIRAGFDDGTIDVLGATAWCWTRPDFEQSVDVLIVDEAGQMSLSNVLAAAPGARSLVLLGDPQQLEQPLQSSHPAGSEVSALYHLLDGASTMPADKGLFLAETYRLHPDIAQFTSEIYYEGRVEARPGLERQAIVPNGGSKPPVAGSGLVYAPVRHAGNQARSMEEVGVIRRLVDALLSHGAWRDAENTVRSLTRRDVLVVAPYNAQVSALTEAMPEIADRIGTVDRFQGQEAPVVIYSMTSSSAEDAPRGMEFLYNRFRFNVATSRARALCILVGSPTLFEPECRTVRQMKMANGFCRYLELAQTVAEGAS
ncbi:TM0106 family RecB-like putative nuclease [soil metagenome]